MGSLSLFLLLLMAGAQSPGDRVRQHYAAAETFQRGGNLTAAEREYRAALADGYATLGKVRAAQKAHKEAAAAFEAAIRYGADTDDVLLDQAIAYFNQEQFEQALAPLGKVLSRNPASEGAQHMIGKTYFMLGKLAPAAEALSAALRLKPDDYDAAYTLGLVHLKQTRLAPAKQIFDAMLRRLGARPQLHILFGRAYRETGFLAEAVEEFKQAIALDPRFPRVHYYLGLTYLLKDGAPRLADAAAEFKIELAAHPDEFFASYYLGVIYVIERKWEQAIPQLEQATRLQPRNPDPYFNLGGAYQELGKYEQAIEALKKSIEFNPSLDHNDYQVTAAHYRLGQSLLKAGRTAEAEKELQVAAELKDQGHQRDEEKTATYLNSANLHEQNGKFPESLSVEGTIGEGSPLDDKTAADLKAGAAFYEKVIASAHNRIALLSADRRDYSSAAEQFAEAAHWNPQLEDIHFNWGLACYKAEQYGQAIAPLEAHLKARPDSLPAKQLLGMSYFMTDDYARAADLLTAVVAVKKNDAGLYYTLAVSLIKQGKQEQAAQVIQQMIVAAGSSPQLHILLGQAYYEQGNTDKSLEELKAALAADTKTRLAHYYTGMIDLKLGKFDEAAREFESELQLNPGDVQSKFHLAFVRLAAQQTAEGVRLMREVVKSKPDYGEAHYELGKALLQLGDVGGAVGSLEMAARLKPEESYVHYQLGRAYLAAGRQADGEHEVERARQLKEKARPQNNQ
ncbi:MAG TPA: tetratricopeptide repeat protein [Blastocatellia bacterium]|nr:tetratricopeptide repeat protein [Blastocatellia bacterium]